MHLSVLTSLIFVLTVLTANASAAQTFEPGLLAAQLGQHPQWHRLLHIRPGVLPGPAQSQADDQDFFYAEKGAVAPQKELEAFLAEIALTTTHPERFRDANQHPACRFPARYHWLDSQHGIRLPDPPTCPDLEEWLQNFDAHQVTMVFASTYLNSPSSMFGHTFLRIDPADLRHDNLLITHTLSYAADAAEADNELLFVWRGIFGGYPGLTSIEAYFQKLKTYSELENRDLWEYRLNLTQQEVQQLMWHAWEIRDIRFDYYFFDENCSYRLLTLLDVARPSLSLTESQPLLGVIPSETVRDIVAADLVADVTYRPAQATMVRQRLGQLAPEERRTVSRLLDADFSTLPNYSPTRRAQLLDTSYELVRYLSVEEELTRSQAAPLSYALLARRSEIPEGPIEHESDLAAIGKTPDTRDDQGHPTQRLGISSGQHEDQSYLALHWRPAYHDLTDPLAGYRPGAHLRFFDTEVRYYNRFYGQEQEFQLERFQVVDIVSLSPRDEFLKPLSWQVSFGAHRSWFGDQRPILTPYFHGKVGVAREFGGWRLAALASGTLEPSSKLPKGLMLEPGATLLASYQSEALRILASVEQRVDIIGQPEIRRFAELGLYYSLTEQQSIFLKSRYHEFQNGNLTSQDGETQQWSLGWYGYF